MTAGRRLAIAALGVALTLIPGPARAQDTSAPRGDRAQLERQFRQRAARVVQQRLGLTDAQMARLQATNQKFEGRRRAMVAEERQIRGDIRAQLAAGDTADQQRVAALIQRAIRVQRQRLELVEQEQGELATFLTPVQRARYLEIQERLRRRVDELRRGQEHRRGAARGRPGGH
jgi:hypothetical protein